MKHISGIIKKHFILFILVIFFNSDIYCQLNVSTAMTPAQLVQNVLLGGGVTVSNITYTGGVNSRASFTNGSTTNLGLNNGIILSTGIVSQIPNPASYFMSTNLGLAGDPDLQVINYGGQTYDACVLQFDFVPLSDTVKFRYVFGSEEYPDYVCSHFNDVFAFFLTGQNPSGGNYTNYNLALIPGSATPVSVNSVNNGTPGSGYPTSGCTSLSYSSYYVDNDAIAGTTICFGGFTTPLTAVCAVVPCQTYHIKIALAEGYNGLYDSGVFLEANSFTSNTFTVNTHYSNSTFGTNIMEGCSQGLFSFILSSPATAPYIINYTVHGTATNGIDYSSIPTSITIPAGQDSAGIYIDPLFDGISEGTETVILTYTNGCVIQSDTINILDNIPLSIVASNDTTICLGTYASLTSIAAGGILPYSYAWSNGSISNNTSVNPTAITTYTLSVSDNCGQSATENVIVNVNSVSPVITPANESCNMSNGNAAVSITGICNFTNVYQWNTGATTQAIFNLPAGSYTVTVSCGACSASATTTLSNISGPSITIDSIINCDCGLTDGAVYISINGGITPYSYAWNTSPALTSEDIQNIPAGNYSVTVTDANGCSADTTVVVPQVGGPVLNVSSTNELCRNYDGTATVVATGGTGTYTYLWSTSPPQTNATATGLPAGTYTVTVDDGNCATTASIVVSSTPGPTAGMSINPPVTTLMNGPVVFSGSSNGAIVNWTWDFGDGTVGDGQSTTHQYEALGTYIVTLVITDNNGCVDSVVDTMKVKDISTLYIPNSFSPNEDGKNDLFQPYGLNIDPDTYEMMIFDRWGQLLFDTKEWGVGWNGTLNNYGTKNDVVLDVYVYKISAKPQDSGKLHEYIGRVFLFP
jgi:gliding motility-associated-like protein